ncbi:hypothetical protein O0L34_g10601 [Tuta absoluta]|nr:hypothetical protein O0L34_g10601 [Tuta absoluta]
MKTLSSADLRSVDNEPAPKVIKLSKNSQDLSKYNEDLLKFSQEKCEFCEKLCFCRYDMLVHNAKHIIIPLKDEIVKCKECKLHFASSMDLEIHTKINHFKVPDILESIVLTKPVVQCDNSLTELVIQNTERKLDKILHKKAVVECDSTVTELIKEKNIEKLKSFVTKQPVIRCEDTLKGLLMSNNTESDKVKPDLLNRQNEIAKLKTDLLKMPKVVLSNNHFSPKKDVDVKPQDLDLKHENITPTDMKSVEMIRKENNSLENITNGTHSIKSRLLFEDDISDFEDDIINTNVMKFNNDIITPKNDFNNDICDLTIDDSDDDDKPIQLHPHVKKLNDSNHISSEEKDQFTPAVHYEDLTEPSVWECKRCETTFNNR